MAFIFVHFFEIQNNKIHIFVFAKMQNGFTIDLSVVKIDLQSISYLETSNMSILMST